VLSDKTGKLLEDKNDHRKNSERQNGGSYQDIRVRQEHLDHLGKFPNGGRPSVTAISEVIRDVGE
jgi:hypothetical protein